MNDVIPNTSYFDGMLYNPNFYTKPTGLTQTYAVSNFLSKTNVDTSTSSSTYFNGQVSISNTSSSLGTSSGL